MKKHVIWPMALCGLSFGSSTFGADALDQNKPRKRRRGDSQIERRATVSSQPKALDRRTRDTMSGEEDTSTLYERYNYHEYQNIFENFSSSLQNMMMGGNSRGNGNKATKAITPSYNQKQTPSPVLQFHPTPLQIRPTDTPTPRKPHRIIESMKKSKTKSMVKDRISRGKTKSRRTIYPRKPSKLTRPPASVAPLPQTTAPAPAPVPIQTPAPFQAPVPLQTHSPLQAKAPSQAPTPKQQQSQVPVRPPSVSGDCISPVAESILETVPDIFYQTPDRCCNFNGPTAVIVTHAFADEASVSGFEQFWDRVYHVMARTSGGANVCFFMMGINSSTSRRIPDVLVDVLEAARINPDIVSIMTTDPSSDIKLIGTVRSISDNPSQPTIGVFNAGYSNVITESILSGREALPYVGYRDEADYGIKAGQATLQLVNDTDTIIPLCFNARIGSLDFVGQRCAAYYASVSSAPVLPEEGVPCSIDSTPTELLDVILANAANVVWTHIDCCAAMGEAVTIARQAGFSVLASGCQDQNGAIAGIDFVTEQPIDLQGYHASTWSNFPVAQQLLGMDGSAGHYFPSLSSFIHTAVFTVFSEVAR